MGCGMGHFIGGESSLHNLPWLLSHGANMDRILPNLEAGRPEGLVIHQLAKHLGAKFEDDIFCYCLVNSLGDRDAVVSQFRRYPGEVRCLLAEMFSRPVFDGCVCSCSSNGCCPATKVLRAITGGDDNNTRRPRHWFIDWVIECIEDRPRLPEWLLAGIIRFETFSRLGLAHTCHDMGLIHSNDMTEEEDREIREEERFLIGQLDDLVVEFVERSSELNQPLLEFFEGYWANRMEEKFWTSRGP
jgi:hypothetical protein